MSFKDKIAVVTGAGSGIGRATAEALAEAGATVDRRRHQPRNRARRRPPRCAARAARREFLPVDLTNDASIAAFAAGVDAQGRRRRHPRQRRRAGARRSRSGKATPELWEKLIALNFVGPMKLAKALLPKMMERGSGKIVNIASDAGRVGSLGETVYSGAKGGLIAFTKSLARETARYNINVNCVCPGPTETPLLFAVPGEAPRGVQEGHPVAPLRQALRDRRRRGVLRQRPRRATSPARC